MATGVVSTVVSSEPDSFDDGGGVDRLYSFTQDLWYTRYFSKWGLHLSLSFGRVSGPRPWVSLSVVDRHDTHGLSFTKR